MSKLEEFKRQLKRGKVYRRNELAHLSNAVDRHLKGLVGDRTLQKLSPGVYYYPKETVFGHAPADETKLVRAFLKDDTFLLSSPNAYNTLGLGTTQLYNVQTVYNHKRHGKFQLGNRTFHFQMKPTFPKKMSEEFLLVDLVNNLDSLAEDQSLVLQNVVTKVKTMDRGKLRRSLVKYGDVKTKKLLSPMLW